jgi:hypothetical protein
MEVGDRARRDPRPQIVSWIHRQRLRSIPVAGDAMTHFDPRACTPPPAPSPTPDWRAWCPGLGNDDLTLRDVLATLPAAPPQAIPWIVRTFENPRGWLHLHGAVDLHRHDMIHVLLGRGLLGQDEAFVIGFTMGATKAVSDLEAGIFKMIASRVYPPPYRIAWRTLAAFDLGVAAGRELAARNLHRLLDDSMLDRPLGAIRRSLGIDTRRLRDFYARERRLLPTTAASRRLPTGDGPGDRRPQGPVGAGCQPARAA